MHKISQCSCILPGRQVFCGFGGMQLPGTFKVAKEGGGRGGVEFAFMSTTTSKEVAVSYIGGKAMPVLVFDVGDIDGGCSLSYVSQYPGEDEILIPAMSYLEVT